MPAVNTILLHLGRSVVDAIAAHSSGDRDGVERELERASKVAGLLLGEIAACDATATVIGDAALELHMAVETVDVHVPDEAVFRALCSCLGLIIRAGRIANGANPFAPLSGPDADDAVVPTVNPHTIIRA